MTVSRRSFLAGAASTAAIAASGGVGAIAEADSWNGRLLINGFPCDWREVSDRSYEAYLRHMMDHVCRSVDLPYDELTEDWRRSIKHWVMPSRVGCTTLEEARAKHFASETIAIEDHTDPSEIDPGRVGHPEA